MKSIFSLIMILMNLVTPVEKISTDIDDTRLDFETVYKGYVYYDIDDFFGHENGYRYPENTFIDSEEQLEVFIQKSGIEFDYSDIDFSEYMLYVHNSCTFGDKESEYPYDIVEISYNEKVLDILFTYEGEENSEEIKPIEGKYICTYNILKIKKSEFPYEPRGVLGHQKHSDNPEENVILTRRGY